MLQSIIDVSKHVVSIVVSGHVSPDSFSHIARDSGDTEISVGLACNVNSPAGLAG